MVIIVLPFLAGLAAVWFGMLGRRRACVALWLVSLAVFGVGLRLHLGAPLGLSW
ncbi:DUF5993 family protein [Achromobacter sp. Marseille-Q4962]|uniref:DUF5993 family protein n=1 Tax=Achromobacter sp. Marseille-Q4962 TaxID=2942202 RepID=UPI00207355D0|nr:DUF5993 family protein [Achromobacter sp. Marseille-Q4962]